MKLAITAFAILATAACFPAHAKECKKPITIAVIDTGFGYDDKGHQAHLCQYGHKDFTIKKNTTKNFGTKTPVPVDVHGHGTNIVGIIDGYASKSGLDYCIVVLKFYSDQQTGSQNLVRSIRAINYATNIGADYINYSGGGPETSRFEEIAVKRFLNRGGHFVAAAGNEKKDIDQPENAYYPALYDSREIVVGNLGKDGVRSDTSNYGTKVTRWEVGVNVEAYGLTFSGTSQATAVATGKIVAGSSNQCDIGF